MYLAIRLNYLAQWQELCPIYNSLSGEQTFVQIIPPPAAPTESAPTSPTEFAQLETPSDAPSDGRVTESEFEFITTIEMIATSSTPPVAEATRPV